MFKKRAIQIKMVEADPAKNTTEHEMPAYMDPERMNEIAKDFVKHTAIVLGVTFVAVAAFSAVARIIVSAAEASNK